MDENKCDIPISHPWLESLDHRTARFDYFSELISLISGSQFTMADYSLVVYPYLFNSVIASQMSMKYEDTFDSHFDRIHVRQEGNDRFNCGYFYKKENGHHQN
ncbi:hypothetical protein ACMYSO_25870 (plasmid) [Klebsiella sp. B345]|uniref:hypothetical protein n=1 Tax=Klebsiella sp. B345 TaxID=2755398 RepID=UPI003DA8B0AC